MAKYELSSARKDDLENTERDIFAPKSRNPEGAELVAACESEISQRDVPLIHQTDDEARQTSGPPVDKLRAFIDSTSNDASAASAASFSNCRTFAIILAKKANALNAK